MSEAKEQNDKPSNGKEAKPTRSFDGSIVGPGGQIGVFRIEQELGRGAAGVVYLAHDTKLDRSVAIKSLPAELMENPKARTRFAREARVLASLNHPNIATIYEELQEAEGLGYLVLEYVAGQTLAERIAGARLKLQEALTIALQIAEAVAAAHEHDVIHRDLKPGNIKITPESKVKVLDFGLAKAIAGEAIDQQTTVTEPGRIIGTPAYMSPEQARGKPTDKRCDIWSFGCVLYEMLTGKVPFEGETVSDTLANVLQTEPDWHALPQGIPANIQVLLRRCLEKDPRRRLRDIGDASIEISETLNLSAVAPPVTIPSVGVSHPTGLRRFIVVGVVCLLFGAVAGSLVTWNLTRPSALPTQQHLINLTDQPGAELFPSLSPTGGTVVYASRESGNWDIYSLRVGGEKPINLTKDSADDDTQPAFSPDGQIVAFRSERDGGGIFMMGATGESPRRVTDFGFNPAWSGDGQEIVFATESIIDEPLSRQTTSQLWVVNVATGQTRQISKGDAVQPHWSPHNHRIAYWGILEGGQRDIATITSEGGEPVRVTNDAATDWNPIWSSDGNYLYFCSDRAGSMNVWRVRIEEPTGKVLGSPESVTSGVSADSVHLSLSGDGQRIAYVSHVLRENIQKIAFDWASGKVEGEPAWVTRGSSRAGSPCPSPGNEWLAYGSRGKQEDIFIVKTDGSGRRQLTDDLRKDRAPQWSPDRQHILFYSDRSGSYEAWMIRRDGSGLKQLTDTPRRVLWYPVFSPDGLRLAYSSEHDEDGHSAFIIDLGKSWEEQTPVALPPLGDPEESFVTRSWSPDGRSLSGHILRVDTGLPRGIAIYSFESQSFQRLTDFGSDPVWLNDSRRLLFVHEGKVFLSDSQTKEHREVLSVRPDAVDFEVGVEADNRWIYFTRKTTEADIWLIDLE